VAGRRRAVVRIFSRLTGLTGRATVITSIYRPKPPPLKPHPKRAQNFCALEKPMGSVHAYMRQISSSRS